MRYQIILVLLFALIRAEEIEPEVTLDRKKLIILSGEDENKKITDKIYQIASSVATKLKRYDVIDRSHIKRILKEQKLQYSGVIDQDQAIELGKVAAANEALLIRIQNFGQKGVPTKYQEKKETEDEPKTGLFGWIVKEVVKAEIDKNTEAVERYPNNINTVIDGELQLINVETNQSIASFPIHADYTGGVKTKSLSHALKQIRSQMSTNLKNLFQLSSEVLDIQGDDITLLLGKNMGINSGTNFEIISRDERKTLRDRDVTIPGKSIGIIKIETVSIDACKGKVLRKWDDIKPGYQAHEITGKIFTGGISGIYGSSPENMRLRFFGDIKPFGRFGGGIYGEIGTVKDTRDDTDFHFSLGFSFNYRLIKTSPFSLGFVLNIPFDFPMRTDDKNSEGQSHLVFMAITSARFGLQSEIMLSPKIDLVIRGEYVLTSSTLGSWRYTEEHEDYGGDTQTLSAYWNEEERQEPEIDYHGWIVTLGIRSTFFSSFASK